MKAKKLVSLWKIHLETFTSLIEFVKNYLVKIESLCHYQKTYPQDHDGSKILKWLNRIEEELKNKNNDKYRYVSQ